MDVCHGAQEECQHEERYPVLKDPALVRAVQLACLILLGTLPSANKAKYITKMYASMESKFNDLFRQRTQRQVSL